jgi:predicted nucleic acid-binding protein
LIYVDGNVVIRLIEGAPTVRDPLVQRLSGSALCTSHLTRLECRSKPLADGNAVLLDAYAQFVAGRDMVLCGLTIAIVDEATRFRAKYHLRTPDALHLASAIVCKAKNFLTGDKNLARVTEIVVEIV